MATDSENILLTYEEVAQAERTSVGAIKNRVYRGTLKSESIGGGHPRIPITELSPTAQARAREIISDHKQAA